MHDFDPIVSPYNGHMLRNLSKYYLLICCKQGSSTHFCHFLATTFVTDVLMGANPSAMGPKKKGLHHWRPNKSMVGDEGCRVRLRRPLPLRACGPRVLHWKTLHVSSAPHPVGFESRRWRRKKPVTTRVTGFAFQMVPPAGFEPAISTLKGWRPWPLDDGDSGKEYSRLFCRRVYRWQTGKPPQRCLSLCGGWSVRGGASSRRRGRRARRCRRGV